jgi:catechol 2,3-dioxygenase-like lactoylglutathione lyase family enzyme
MSIVAMNHTSFTVSDLERSIAFYCDVLGFELVKTIRRGRPWIAEMTGFPGADLKIAVLQLGGREHVLELIEYASPTGAGPRRVPTNDVGAAHVSFSVMDIDAVYHRLVDAGVEFVSPPITVAEQPSAGARAAYFRDPDGIPLELQQHG